MTDVRIGQVYRDKDSRFLRYVRIDSFASKNGLPAVWCLRCDVGGNLTRGNRVTRIKIANIQTRFILVKDSEEKV